MPGQLRRARARGAKGSYAQSIYTRPATIPPRSMPRCALCGRETDAERGGAEVKRGAWVCAACLEARDEVVLGAD